MKNDVFYDMEPRGSRKNRRFGETCRLYLQGDNLMTDGKRASCNGTTTVVSIRYRGVIADGPSLLRDVHTHGELGRIRVLSP
jgi:hypothetical protein